MEVKIGEVKTGEVKPGEVATGRSAGERLGAGGVDTAGWGSKAASLHELMRASFQVPHGFVLPGELALPDAVAIAKAVAAIGGWPVAVRSSAVAEDLSGASFAGQYESFLNVRDTAGLLAAAREVRESVESERVKSYAQKRGGVELTVPSVLIQRMVDAEVAGVAFTLDPMTGIETRATLEFCQGLGDKLVQGRIQPGSLVLDLESGLTISSTAGADGATLSKDRVRRLHEQLLEIQALFGQPQDIEWAIDRSDKLWILQSRPITKFSVRSDVAEFTNADLKDGGVSSSVCTPLMQSLYRRCFEDSMQRYLSSIRLIERSEKIQWMASFYGRPYWNAGAVKKCLQKLPGFDESKFDRDLGIEKEYPASGPIRVKLSARTLAGALPVAFALRKQYQVGTQSAEAYRRTFPERESAWLARHEKIIGATDAEFFIEYEALLEEFYYPTETAYFNTIYNNSNAQTELKELLEKIDRLTGGQTDVNLLMGGLTDIEHMRMQGDFRSLAQAARRTSMKGPQWEGAFATFIARNYYHSNRELDLVEPRWGEAPDRVLQLVRALVASGSRAEDETESALRQKKAFEVERDSVEARLAAVGISKRLQARMMRGSFRARLETSRGFLSLREKMRDISTRAYGLVRKYSVEAGHRLHRQGRLTQPSQIFMLKWEELAPFVSWKLSVAEASTRILFRSRMYQAYRAFTPPHELGAGVKLRAEETACSSEGGLRGIGCSPGSVRGPVRVITRLEDIGEIREGEILVTRFTDPGWTPALGMVRGVVTEVGGALSHAAVISREYGIPAVLNLSSATKLLVTGEWVEPQRLFRDRDPDSQRLMDLRSVALTFGVLALPVVLAGVFHMIVVRLGWFRVLARPIQSEWFGRNKTWRGLLVMPLATVAGVSVTLPLARALGSELEVHLEDRSVWLTGIAVGLGYALAELPNSFVKRRKGIAEGGLPEAHRFWHAFVDQADSAVGCTLAYLLIFRLPWPLILALALVGPILHLGANLGLFALGLRREPL